MSVEFFVIIYNNSSSNLADFIAENYHLKHNIIYSNLDHPKEKKEAIMYKVEAGTSQCPFLGAYDSEGIIDALWGETTKITPKTITEFFKKYE